MPVWSDEDFRRAVASARFSADPWRPQDLTPNGLDLRVASVLVPASGAATGDGEAVVPPLQRFLVGTQETLRLPPDAAGSLWLRSSYARRGVLASFGKVDAGFRGNLTVGAFNSSHEALRIPIGDRFCQIVMEDLATPSARPYAGRYQDQQGITTARP